MLMPVAQADRAELVVGSVLSAPEVERLVWPGPAADEPVARFAPRWALPGRMSTRNHRNTGRTTQTPLDWQPRRRDT